MTGRIVFFVSHAAGGVGEVWADLASGLAERGHDVALASLYPHVSGEQPGDGRPWTYILPDHPHGLGGKWRLARELARWMRRERPALILTAMPAANVIVPIFARLFSPQTRIITSHHSPVDTYNPWLRRLDAVTGTFDNVRANVTVSQAVADTIADRSRRYRARSGTIENALPRRVAERLQALRATRVGRTPGRVAIAIGRLSAEKNAAMLIRAAALVPGAHVRFVGSGPDEPALRSLADQLAIADRIHFLGQCDRGTALARLAEADVFVQVSRFEGRSLALIEAATVGLPLIVSDVPGQREGVRAADGEYCGQIVPLDDDVALGRAMASVFDDPEARRRWEAQARKLADKTTFDAMVDRYEAIIRQDGPHWRRAI